MDFITLAAAKKYAKDIQPFKENAPLKSFYWDGDTTNLRFVNFNPTESINFTWYKISEEILSEKEIMKGIITVLAPEDIFSANATIMPGLKTDNGSFIATSSQLDGLPLVVVCGVDGDKFSETIEGVEIEITFPEAGLWFCKISMDGEGRTLFLNIQPDVTTIDSKFLPEGCAGREFGDRVYWNLSPTDTYEDLGMHIEWDGSNTEVFVIVPSQSEEMEIPEGTAFYKVSDKINTIIGKTFHYQWITGTGTSNKFTTETVIQLIDNDSGDIIGEAGKLANNSYCVANLKKRGKVNFLDVEIEFLEEGLYFIKIPEQGRVIEIYDEMYNNMSGLSVFKVTEALEDDLFHSTLEVCSDGQIMNLLITEYDEEETFAYYGKTENDSSYCYPFVFNIKTDNEIIDLSDFMEVEDYKHCFKKSGLYMVNPFSYNNDKNYFLLKGKNYNNQKISQRFLPDTYTVIDYVSSSSSSPISSYGVYKALGNRYNIYDTNDVSMYNYNFITSHGVANKLREYYHKDEVNSLIQNLTDEINNLKNKLSELEI